MFRDEVATKVKSNTFEDETLMTLCLIYLGKVALKTSKNTLNILDSKNKSIKLQYRSF